MKKTIQEKIQIIRQKIVMLNNLDCKTYEEAIEKESKSLGALALFTYDEKKELMNGCYARDLIKANFFQDKIELIGLPLNIERILVAINISNIYYRNGKIVTFEFIENSLTLCDWIPNQSLENQSDETINTIYSLLINI